ncbi:MAG: hypothetical protein LBT01_05110 [Spirochaetaceae bacterium]|jgi:hypothetical protein|nr:hypothetical protein [Spirochaetaceae bacterium]
MSDKLDWLNKHLVLVRCVTMDDAVGKEGYKIRPDLEELCAGVRGAQEMIFKFATAGRYKCAAELMASIGHHRAIIWWAYRCVISLLEELAVNPSVDRDIADIASNFEVTVPDFAKVQPPEPDMEKIAKIKADIAQSIADLEKAKAQLDPEIVKLFDEALEVGYQKFKAVQGIHPMDLIKKLGERVGEDQHPIDRNSPIFQEAAKIKAQLGAIQKETVDTIKSVIPPKMPAHEKKVRDNALSAVYRWISAPDEPNSKACLELGNECPDTPAGLLSLSAFWAFGNLMPGGKQVIHTPPGLAANGICQVLLMCALHKGGTRKLKERYELYFKLGVDVLSGADNWEYSLASESAPHEKIAAAPPPTEKPAPPHEKFFTAAVHGAVPQAPSAVPPPHKNRTAGYKRWKPE